MKEHLLKLIISVKAEHLTSNITTVTRWGLHWSSVRVLWRTDTVWASSRVNWGLEASSPCCGTEGLLWQTPECPTFPARCKQGVAAPESRVDAFVGMSCSSFLPASAAPAAIGTSLHKADIPGARKKPKHCAWICDGEQMRGIVIQMKSWGHFNPC